MPALPLTPVRFPFQVGLSEIYGRVTRPVAEVQMRIGRMSWQPYVLAVDSGADFTLVSGLVGVVLGFTRGRGETVRRVKGIAGAIPVRPERERGRDSEERPDETLKL